MVVSDYLTYIAECIVEHVVERAWLMLTEKHGFPPGSDNKAIGFAVFGFGKLGGIELGYGSDLDMVFLYDCEDGNALTDGPKPIPSMQFYGRLGLKVRHILDTKLLSGVLYDVDMRLRPSGNSGLLVSHINAYEDYLRNQAWTWEHQALVRARVLVGCPRVAAAFEQVRAEVLGQSRDLDALRREVSEMRGKMRDNLGTRETAAGTAGNAFAPGQSFDLKQDAGGIVDIEFMVQYAALAWSHQHPQLLRYTDNIRILDGLGEAGLLPQRDVSLLQEAYKAFRALAHRQALQKQPGKVDAAQLQAERHEVLRIWRELGLQ
jgi:glutamate-ammonia-ligase adenylyltransferase